jgi:hypothetical protein
MSVPNGNAYPIIPCVLRAAALAVLFCGGLVSTLAANKQAHPPWTRIAQRDGWTPDIGWKPGPYGGKGASQLLEGGKGRLFLSHGDSLFLSDDQGRTWRAAAALSSPAYYEHRRAAFAVGPTGLVMWGNRISHDFGSTWQPPHDSSARPAFAYSIVGNRAWGGGLYDVISLSEDSGRTWKSVHYGKTYGRIEDFAYSWKGGGWYLAAPQADQVQISRDGIVWTDLASRVAKVSGQGDPVRKNLRASILAQENMAYDQILWAVETAMPDNLVLAEIRTGPTAGLIGNDSISLVWHEAASGPDSAVTSFGIYSWNGGSEATLWLGTWGQGVFMSHDRGETWHAWNSGLGDLHVQSLLVPDHGWNDSVFALTRDGLYRLGAPPSGLAQAPRRSGSGTGPGGTPRSRFLLKTPSGSRVRPDGRRASLPGSKP